ncbi:FecR family protein [Flavivirga spongiicola]|uniref:DUF4974 domain-containing protein n=1 Tax=Flavivirga spongiicola TaxID=421621 RepID=A0ABU7XV86_9FLAO|nr:FecR family protein [Flavivirga sp. MEBiC05379]MDO5979679.1 DUF4974 domain-containing protein [Flavivirga sp. MEBiC05379]
MSIKEKNDLLLLIDKLFKGDISENEVENLSNFFSSHQKLNEWPFEIEAKSGYREEIYSKIQLEIAKRDKANTKVIPFYKRSLLKYAAAILIFVSVGYFFLNKNQTVNLNTPIIVNNNIEVGTDKAILTLDDGTDVALEKGQDYIADNLTSNGEEIVYQPTGQAGNNVANNQQPTTKNQIAYNYLTIPRGGQYLVKLSDGTQVWLNSESQIKYPISFPEGETREVELVYGEAYFDVSPSTEHNGSKFKVLTGAQEVEVLGTEFNIKAYQDEDFIYTTLVEGKVLVNNATNNNVLSPNQQNIMSNVNNDMLLLNVVDMYSITAWKKGVFSFKDMPLNKIMKVLSRWYDTEVIFINKDVEEDKFTGVLGKEQTIEDILFTIYNTNNIKYEINNKTIIFR